MRISNMELQRIVNEFRQEIMPPFDDLIEVIGFETLCVMTEEFGGTAIYIPSKKNMFKGCIEKQILKEFNGHNLKTLCQKYGLCQTTVKQIVAR